MEGKIIVAQLSVTAISSTCDIIYDFERWVQWKTFEYCLKSMWLTSPEPLSEQWDWVKEVTLNSSRPRPALSADFRG